MTGDELRTARLEALAAVRAMLAGDNVGARLMIDQAERPAELARTACGLAVGVLSQLPADLVATLLDRWIAAAVGPNGAEK